MACSNAACRSVSDKESTSVYPNCDKSPFRRGPIPFVQWVLRVLVWFFLLNFNRTVPLGHFLILSSKGNIDPSHSTMLLTIPYSTLELSKITCHPFYTDKRGRRIAHLTYKDGLSELSDLTFVTPPLTFVRYDPTTNRLQLDLSRERPFLNKWNALQDAISQRLYMNCNSIFSKSYAMEDIQSMLHRLCMGHFLSVYVFPTTPVHLEDGTTMALTDLKAGTSIRCILRIHGLLCVEQKGPHGSLRISHSVPGIYKITA